MKKLLTLISLGFAMQAHVFPCSVLYYVDRTTGSIFVANHEDYWLNTKAYIMIEPSSEGQFARLWYGWKDFAQGGVNEAGLFFDGAVSPEQEIPPGYSSPDGNLGDRILANCETVAEAVEYLESENVALTGAHMIFGDANGDAVVVEWVGGERKIIAREESHLILENFLLSNPSAGNYPSHRYQSIQERIKAFEAMEKEADLLTVGNFLGAAAQPPTKVDGGKVGGTLYSTFLDVTDMEFVIIPKLDNSRARKFDLREEFQRDTRKKIKLSSL